MTKTFTAVRLDPDTLKKINALVKAGHYRNRTEAIEAGLDFVLSRAINGGGIMYPPAAKAQLRKLSPKEYAARLAASVKS